MSIEHDPRTGTSESGTATVAAGDGDSPHTVVEVPSDALYKPVAVKVEYGGSASTVVNLYDEGDSVAAGDLSDQRDTFTDLSNNAVQQYDGPYGVFEDDVVVNTDGNQDGDAHVTVYGYVLTDLQDVSSL